MRVKRSKEYWRAYQRKWYEKNRSKILLKNRRIHKKACLNCAVEFFGHKNNNKFCSRRCMGLFVRSKRKDKYILVSNGLGKSARGWYRRTPEHRVIVEKAIGRPLKKTEVVHHINEDKRDNRLENLVLFNSCASHTNWHKFTKKLRRIADNDIVYRLKGTTSFAV